MTVELRPHHLLCILTYAGKGYSADFTRNYDRIVERLNAGEAIEIVSGPDAICAPLMCAEDDPHCLRASVNDRDRRASRDLSALLRRPVAPGESFVLDPITLVTLRRDFATGNIRRACAGCEWSDLCTAIARADFQGVQLSPPSE